MHDSSEEEDEESSPVITQIKKTNAESGSSPPTQASTFDKGGTSTSGASGAGAPTAPLRINKNANKDGESESTDGKKIYYCFIKLSRYWE